MTAALSFRVLGPLAVEKDGVPLRIAGQRPKSVLALLLLHAGRVVAASELIRGIWGEDAPDRSASTLQVHVSNLRKLFDDAEPAVLTRAPGYVLHASEADLDLLAFDDLIRRAAATASSDPASAEQLLAAALDLWQGRALADLDSAPSIDLARTWLEERRLGVVEDRLSLLLGLGRHREVVGEAESWVAGHPLHEPLWETLIIALYRSGRQADALAAYSRARARLLEDLGIEPGGRLRDLERAVLNQDRALDLPARAEHRVRSVSVTVPPTLRVSGPSGGWLELVDGSTMVIGERFTIGRHPGCDLTLSDPLVSRHHAEIRATAGGYLLVDTSSNGTRVNGTPTIQHVLADGDTIQIASVVLIFRASEPT